MGDVPVGWNAAGMMEVEEHVSSHVLVPCPSSSVPCLLYQRESQNLEPACQLEGCCKHHLQSCLFGVIYHSQILCTYIPGLHELRHRLTTLVVFLKKRDYLLYFILLRDCVGNLPINFYFHSVFKWRELVSTSRSFVTLALFWAPRVKPKHLAGLVFWGPAVSMSIF